MNRKTFFKKLFLGAVVIYVTPKVIAEATKPSKKTCGIIPFLSKKGARIRFDSRTELQPGDIVTTGTEEGIVREENGNLIADLYPIIQERQFFWMRMQSAIEKAQHGWL